MDWVLEQLSYAIKQVNGLLCAYMGDVGASLSALEHLARVAPFFRAAQAAAGLALHPRRGVAVRTPGALACSALCAGGWRKSFRSGRALRSLTPAASWV